MKFRIYASFLERSIYYIYIPCPINMPLHCADLKTQHEFMLKWDCTCGICYTCELCVKLTDKIREEEE
jgi:hypothetical protein